MPTDRSPRRRIGTLPSWGLGSSKDQKMATELALIEPIQLPARPDQMPSLPAWLRQRSDVLESGADLLPNGLPDPFAVPTLPAEMLLSSSERAMVEHHIAGLSQFLDL